MQAYLRVATPLLLTFLILHHPLLTQIFFTDSFFHFFTLYLPHFFGFFTQHVSWSTPPYALLSLYCPLQSQLQWMWHLSALLLLSLMTVSCIHSAYCCHTKLVILYLCNNEDRCTFGHQFGVMSSDWYTYSIAMIMLNVVLHNNYIYSTLYSPGQQVYS